ncbi:alpha/beta-hydrolase [Hymenopellis radicata]|nr:alpha/beta-hydrolase [Hymenopellis radicata]
MRFLYALGLTGLFLFGLYHSLSRGIFDLSISLLAFTLSCNLFGPQGGHSLNSPSAYNPKVPRWRWSPPLGPLPGSPKGSYLKQDNGVSIWYAELGCEHKGKDTPVLLLHGGQGNSNQMHLQAKDLVRDRYVVVTDTRGQGRSPYAGFDDMHYDDIARDTIALLDHLDLPKVAVVGWSDGAITGLNMAMNYTDRIDRVFAHAANAHHNQSTPTHETFPPLRNNNDWASFNVLDIDRAGDPGDPYSYPILSPTPNKEEASNSAVAKMWATEPTWGADAFALIKAPVWIVGGDRDEAISRNQLDAMAAWTPFAGQLLLPQTGHNAHAQDSKLFNFAMRYFLEMNFDEQLPVY